MKMVTTKCSYCMIVLACIVATGCTTYGRGPGQVDISDSNENQSLSMLQQINELETENTNLKNQVEMMQYQLEQLNRRAGSQQDELDRLYKEDGLGGYTYQDLQEQQGQPDASQVPVLTPPVAGQPGVQEPSTPGLQQGDATTGGYTTLPAPVEPVEHAQPAQPSATVASTRTAQELYNSGFEQLKQGKYDESIQTFSALLAQYPGSTFADDAQYWTGEAYYVNRNFASAQQAFNQVVNVYPNSDRAPDALLKIGYIYYEQGDTANARRIFNEIVVKYPNERVSDFARERLNNLGG